MIAAGDNATEDKPSTSAASYAWPEMTCLVCSESQTLPINVETRIEVTSSAAPVNEKQAGIADRGRFAHDNGDD